MSIEVLMTTISNVIEAKYTPSEIEGKWVEKWSKEKLYEVTEDSQKPKSYVLIEFPYPSGDRLHVGHARSYSCLDAVARLRRMKGMNVLYPMGWDAFGLPAENYAIKTGVHPSVTTKQNIDHAKKQAMAWGLSFDWTREVNTTDPDYYRWTQWIFIKLFEKGLAYKEEITVNWCPSCKTNLANEEVVDGKCERCGAETERRKQAQWLLRITAYADRLLEDLNTVNFREDIAAQQINWIGKKAGINIRYKVQGARFKNQEIEVFTTRPDTNFGATFVVLAPEHDLVAQVAKTSVKVRNYVKTALDKSERERQMEGKKKTGVFLGLYAINDLTGDQMPIYVSDFVLSGFGTGAVVGVPGHDVRDFEFAQAMKLPIRRVVVGNDGDTTEITKIEQVQEEEGIMVNSGFLDGLNIHEATVRVMDYMEEKGLGKRASSYHLRDWIFSRQHYWGEPIPMVHCSKCGWVPVPEEQLPVKLPQVEKYQPSGTGQSPLATISEWVNTTCPACGGKATRETDTMPNWAGSSWYFLRYCDPLNNKVLGDKEKLAYWLPVDWYNGGMEHTTLHLLYSRFWHKFLYDLGIVPTAEPYARRTSHGVVLGPDGKKMSKSKGNVINPDEVVSKYGADTLRMYEMFIGPFEQSVAWSWESVEGVFRFMKRVWTLITSQETNMVTQSSGEAVRRLHALNKKIENDLEGMKFNTAVAAMMEFLNWWTDHKSELGKAEIEKFVLLLAPMAPFISEELYQRLRGPSDKFSSVHTQSWPKYEVEFERDQEVTMVVQVDGRVRAKITTKASAERTEIEKLALEQENVKKYLDGKKYRVVFVPGKVVSFIVE